jgi:hypothetical protein
MNQIKQNQIHDELPEFESGNLEIAVSRLAKGETKDKRNFFHSECECGE